MSDTFHIKRFEEHGRYYDQDGFEYVVEQAHNDLAHHLELEHERNNQLEEKLNALISIVRQASFPPGTFDKVHKLFESSRNEFFKSVKEEGDLPKGENN